MKKTYKYRAYLDKQTQANAGNWLEHCRQLYNLCLEQRIYVYKHYKLQISSKKGVNYYDQQNQLPEFKKEFPEFAVVPSQTLQDVVRRLDRAYANFFRRVKSKKVGEKAGFPRFKGYSRYDSFSLTQPGKWSEKRNCQEGSGWKLRGSQLIISRLGTIRLKLHRPIEGDIKQICIRRNAVGKWYVTFSCDNIPERKLETKTNEVGLDVGIEKFIADSDGYVIENPRWFATSQKELRKKARRLARRKKGSNRRNKARVQVALMHERTANQRNDFSHKTANYFIENYGSIYVEDLQIKNMSRKGGAKKKGLNKGIVDASWGKFFENLSYKAEEAGREVIKIKPHYTSQVCSGCGEIVKKSLSTRTHECPSCGLVLDRDANAALNILRAGQALQTLT